MLDHTLIMGYSYGQTYNSSFHKQLESIQYQINSIRGSSKEKIYQELGFEPLQVPRRCSNFCFFYKLLNNEHPQYLFNLIPVRHALLFSNNNVYTKSKIN